ncbi:MAG TPA: hypothetical protein VL854_03555 [Nitrososphaeraceae archaeon]|nr:hypothetical protein [Nitrososphaeraceae archaeon]
MKIPPRVTYQGLTIVLANPSRFDIETAKKNKKDILLSGTAGNLINDCLQPEMNRLQCELRTADDKSTLLPNTKGVLLLGQDSLKWLNIPHSLNEIRGTPYRRDGVVYIASYLPQDACDIVNHEAGLNPLLNEIDETREDYDTGSEKGRHGRTARSNYRFWLERDARRILRSIRGRIPTEPEPTYRIYWPITESCKELEQATDGSILYLDIETDGDLNINTIGFAIDDGPIYVVPLFNHQYKLCYNNIGKFLWSLEKAFKRCCVVSHNGSNFDWFVLAHKYNIVVGDNLFDTMLAMHRCFPEAEKSLGHCMSTWTWQPFHKDEGIYMPNSDEQDRQLWAYNGKDVYGMRLVYKAIMEYAKTIPGLEGSIQHAMKAIKPYLTMTFFGIPFDDDIRGKIQERDDRLMTQYLRCMQILTGPSVSPLISNQKCVRYFHDMMDYQVIRRSKITGKPSLNEYAIQKLRLKHRDNPVLELLLAYRALQKENSSLGFNIWK